MKTMIQDLSLHEKAQRIARSYLLLEKEFIEILQLIDRGKCFISLGYPSLFVYCTKALSLSEAQAYSFITVSRKCSEVPALQKAISASGLTVSKARRIVAVIDDSNATTWLGRAMTLTAKELEKAVVATKPEERIRSQIRPVSENRSRMTLSISSETESLIRRGQDLLSQQQQKHCDLEATVAEMAAYFIKHKDPLKRKVQVKIEEPKTVTRMLRRSVLQRDQGACQTSLPTGEKCGQGRWIDLHHVTSRSVGGSNRVENLITLCRNHHRNVHSVEGS